MSTTTTTAPRTADMARTSRFFDSYAHDFDAIYGNKHTFLNKIANNLFRRSMRVRYQKSIEGCDPIEGRSVLDIGCGPGHYSVAVAKRGAARVLGVDFAEGMLDVARKHAQDAGVGARCGFIYGDFLKWQTDERFDYAIACGFFDYMPDPEAVIRKVLSLTRRRAFFSFPADDGLLAWQRKLRYKSKCDLFLYNEASIRRHFAAVTDKRLSVEKIDRDYFVTVFLDE